MTYMSTCVHLDIWLTLHTSKGLGAGERASAIVGQEAGESGNGSYFVCFLKLCSSTLGGSLLQKAQVQQSHRILSQQVRGSTS